jgi:hypothetical protein
MALFRFLLFIILASGLGGCGPPTTRVPAKEPSRSGTAIAVVKNVEYTLAGNGKWTLAPTSQPSEGAK